MKSICDNRISDRLAVCSWSLKPRDPERLIKDLEEIGIMKVQLALNPLCSGNTTWTGAIENLTNFGIEVVSGMFGTIGEDYTSPLTIQRTGGVVPNATWDRNWEHIQAVFAVAKSSGMDLVTFHAGFIPSKKGDPNYGVLVDRIAMIADLFASGDITLAFETGQETAETLNTFLLNLGMKNVAVNFDPANMLLYRKGNPTEALTTLAPWICQCHIKDAIEPVHPGKWGTEVPVGQGQVDWNAFFFALESSQFSGNLAIEREHGDSRVKDIRDARLYVEQILSRPKAG